MVSPTEGFISGNDGILLKLRFNRWIKDNLGTNLDDWAAVSAIKDEGGMTGWALGSGRGTRIKLDEGVWDTTGPADRKHRARLFGCCDGLFFARLRHPRW